MAIKPANFLLWTCTQGSADAFVQTQIPTGLSTLNNFAYRIRCVEWQGSVLPGVDSNIVVSMSRRTKTATPSWTDPDTIFMHVESAELVTSGFVVQSGTRIWEPNGEAYIVEDNVFCQLDSATTSASNFGSFRLSYDIIRITDAERSALLARTFLSTAA